jgi:hypothetical protein
MDIDLLVEEIMDAVNNEPEADYGDPQTDNWVRDRGIRARVQDILQDALDEWVKENTPEDDGV